MSSLYHCNQSNALTHKIWQQAVLPFMCLQTWWGGMTRWSPSVGASILGKRTLETSSLKLCYFIHQLSTLCIHFLNCIRYHVQLLEHLLVYICTVLALTPLSWLHYYYSQCLQVSYQNAQNPDHLGSSLPAFQSTGNHILTVCSSVNARSDSSFQLTQSYITWSTWKSNRNHCTLHSC